MLSPKLAQRQAGGCSRHAAGYILPGLSLSLLALVSGCAAGFAPAAPLRVDAGPQTLHTSQPLTLSASLDGEPAAAQWRILSTTNAQALGRGTITGNSSYVAPAILSRDQVTVVLGAASGTQTAETTLTINPAFAQPLQPENAALPAAATLVVRAQLAEVTSGTVRWRLAAQRSATGQAPNLGTLSGEHCTRAHNHFTTCTVLYTAPSVLPADPHVEVIATAPGLRTPAQAVARLLLGTLWSNPLLHQQEQRSPIALGSSGSNDNDFDTFADQAGAHFVADCCGGTLGAMVEDQSGTPYLLSNNHVLATSDQGRVGDPIEHPGLIDDACMPLTHPGAQLRSIGNLRYAVPLAAGNSSSNVDAALASIQPGGIDPSGSILELAPEKPGEAAAAGLTANTLAAAPPTAGIGETLDATRLADLHVVKSGRTTGLTCSTVEAVDLRISVDYYKDCAEAEPYTTRTFSGQIAVGGEAFADAGDSGALLLDAANARAIGLLYATATTGEASLLAPRDAGASSSGQEIAGPAMSSGKGLTLAHPIGDVLAELGAQISPSTRLSVRGSDVPHRLACLNYDTPAPRPALSSLSPDERTRAAAAVETATRLRANPAVLSLASGVSEDSPGEGAVLVYTAAGAVPVGGVAADRALLPAAIAGVRTVILPGGQARQNEASMAAGLSLNATQLALSRAVAERLAPALMSAGLVLGVGVAQSLDDASSPALLVLLDADAPRLAVTRALQAAAAGSFVGGGGNVDQGGSSEDPLAMPVTLGGLRVRYMRIHRFRVTQSKYLAQGAPSSCSVRQLEAAP